VDVTVLGLSVTVTVGERVLVTVNVTVLRLPVAIGERV